MAPEISKGTKFFMPSTPSRWCNSHTYVLQKHLQFLSFPLPDQQNPNPNENPSINITGTLTFSISLSSQIHGGKLEFFPLLVALTLGEEEDQTARHLEELKAMVRDVLDRFKAEVRVYVSMWRKGRQRKVQWCTTLCVMDMEKVHCWLLLFLQEQKTTLRDKLQEQAKWEEQNLGREYFSDPSRKEASFDQPSQ